MVILTAIFIHERVSIVSLFKDHYKNVGGYINTNRFHLPVYIFIASLKWAYSLMLVYFFIPRQVGLIRKSTEILLFTGLIYLLEWATMRGIFFLTSNLPDVRVEWHIYSPLEVLSYFIFWLIIAFGLYYVRLALIHFEDLKSVFSQRAMLKKIRAQNEPHFLFNSLNSIYALSIQKGVPEISEVLEKLTNNLRYVYRYQDSKLVPVAEELRNILDYVELQKARIDQRKVEIRIDQLVSLEDLSYKIPALCFLNYVENAFQHGISYQNPAYIHIRFREDEEGLHLGIENSVHKEGEQEGEGLYLSRTLLKESMKKGSYVLDIQKSDGDYRVNLLLKK